MAISRGGVRIPLNCIGSSMMALYVTVRICSAPARLHTYLHYMYVICLTSDIEAPPNVGQESNQSSVIAIRVQWLVQVMTSDFEQSYFATIRVVPWLCCQLARIHYTLYVVARKHLVVKRFGDIISLQPSILHFHRDLGTAMFSLCYLRQARCNSLTAQTAVLCSVPRIRRSTPGP